MSLNSITRQQIKDELVEAARQIAKKYGVDAEYQGGTYTDTTDTIKIEFFDVKGKKDSSEYFATLMGLPSDIVGKTFKNKTKTFTVKSVNPKRPKNCIELVDQNGKGFVCSVVQLNTMMNQRQF